MFKDPISEEIIKCHTTYHPSFLYLTLSCVASRAESFLASISSRLTLSTLSLNHSTCGAKTKREQRRVPEEQDGGLEVLISTINRPRVSEAEYCCVWS